MSTIADYSVFTKVFLASGMTDFSQLYGKTFQGETAESIFRAFAVIPFNHGTLLTPREAMNFDWSKLGLASASGPASGQVSNMYRRVSCRDADGKFIGNIVRVQPGERDGSIRFVAKVAVPDFVSSEDGSNPADAPYNTFVLVRTDASTNIDLPIAVATISKGYNLHKHKVVVAADHVNDPFYVNFADPLDDVENANYVSFTINHLNGYTSVDFNPDAYATYDDVANALSRSIDGLHIAFDTASGDLKLLDKDGNVLDQANLPIKADVIIAEGEEGYKYVKTDVKQDIHAAKAWMPEGFTAWEAVGAVSYTMQHAALVREGLGEGKVCNGIRVRWPEQAQGGSEQAPLHDEIFCVFLKDGDGNEGTESGKKYLAWYRQQLQPSGGVDPISTVLFRTASGTPIEVTNPDSKIYPNQPKFDPPEPVYNHDVFVHTVGNSSLADWDECFQLMGFHVGDDIPLGTNLAKLSTDLNGVDANDYMHGKDNKATREKEVDDQRANAKEELVAWNAQHPALTEDRSNGTIIDSTGLDVRNGRITLGCGRVGDAGVYGIQMKDRSQGDNISGSLDFTISHSRGEVQFDENGHAVQSGDDGGLAPLTSSTLLSIEANSYISGAPTCLILAKVSRKPKDASLPDGSSNPPVLTPVRMTAGFRVAQNYDASSGLNLTLHDYRENISAVLVGPDGIRKSAPAIIEVQAIYTHSGAQYETVPAQQMHTYIGEWIYEGQPHCSFLCNKIEEWMTAIDLTDTSTNPDAFTGVVRLYVVIRVY